MSDKDLLARLRAKAETAQSSPELPSTEQAAGGSDLLERLKAKSNEPVLETTEPAPVQSEWEATPAATIDTAPKPIGVSAGITPSAQNLTQKAPVVSEQKTVKTPFRESPIKLKPRTPLEVQAETTWATSALSNDFDSGIDALPPQYKQNATTIAYTDPNNPIHKITDPHGDPAYTGTYLQSRMNSLAADINKANAEGDLQTRDQYQAKLKDLRKAGAVVVDLQLFNKEYSQKKYTPELAATAISAADERYKAQKAALETKLAAIDKWEHPDGVPAEKARRQIQYAEMPALEKSYQNEIRNVKAQTKYNPVLLGAEKEALLGNKDAQKDYEMLLSGKAIDPARNYAYQDIGRRVIQLGIDNTQNENAKKEAAKHADVEGKALISENLSVLTDRARQVIANKKYNDENAFVTAIIPSAFLRNISKEEIKKYAEEEGFGAEVTNELLKDPAAIPKTVSLAQQTAKGALNFLAPSLYSSGIRALGSIYDVPSEKMDEFFQPGWQEQRGVAAKIAGNMPSEQNSFRNIQGALGTMVETIGMMVPFSDLAKGITQGLEGAGLAEATGERLANGGIMAFEGYNNAYNESKDIVGDRPEDEGMRQAYSILSGLANGAIFSVHPPSKLVKAATGEMVKTGEALVNEMRKVGLKGVMSSEFAPSYAKYIKEIAKAQGIIVSQADANHIAQNGLKNMFSKDGKKTSLTEGLGEETLRTYISFFLPTLAGGVGAARSESPLNRAAAFDVATNAQKYRDFARTQLNERKYTESEYRSAIKGIDLLSSSLENTPVVNSYGEQMTPDQIKEYTFNLAMDGSLRDKLTSLKKGAELTKREVDKAQTAPIEQRISELEKRRSEILDTKMKEVVPEEEVAAEEEAPKENLVESEEKDISLQPDIDLKESSQQKPQQDGNEQSNQGTEGDTGQSKSTGSREETELRQTGNDQGRSEQEAGGPIVAEPKDQKNETTVEQGEPRPAQRVKGKRRTGFKEEEAPEPVENAILSNEQKIEENASIRSEEQQQESGKQGNKPEHEGAEQARSETAPTEAEGGNRNKRSEEEEKVSAEEEFDWEGLFNTPASEQNKSDALDLELEARRKEYKKSNFSKKWAATYDEAVTKLKADYKSAIATYFDYLRREYKKTGPDAKVFVGDEVGGRDMKIDSINERRRQRNIKGAEIAMKDAIEDLKRLGLTGEEISDFIASEKEKFEPSKKEEKVTPVRAEPTSFDEMLAEPESAVPQQNAAPKGPKEIKDVTPHVTRSKTTDYIHLQEGMEVGDKVTFKQGNKTKYGTISGEVVKRSKNKDLIGAHKIKAENTKKTFDFKSYNAAKKEIFSKIGEPETLEEAVLLHLLGGGTFRMGKDGKGIERHLGTRKNTEENKAARSAWLTEYSDRTKKDVADADQFGYDFNPESEQNEGEIGEILTQYKNKAEVVDRLLEIANEKEENRRKVEEYTPSVIEIPVTDHENGTVSYVYLDVTDPHFDEKYSAIIGIPDSELPVAFSEEGHPIYEEGLMHQEAIDNAALTDAEADIINQIFGDNTDNLGEVDIENAHHELIKNIDRFTPDTQELIRKISPFPFGDENVEPAKKIISKIQKYESEKRSAAEATRAAKLSEPSAEAESGEGVPEGRVPEQPGNAYEEPETVDEADNRLVEIADEEKELRLELQKQRASQKIASDKMNKAEKEGNIDEANKQKDNYYKKEAKINKINDRLVELAKEERNIELDKRLMKYKSGSDRLRKWGDDITKGSGGMIGSFPGINPKNVKAFIDAVADIYSHIGNLDVAISKAIDRLVFNGLEKALSNKDVRNLRKDVEWIEEVPDARPKLSKANEEIAYDYVEDILDKDVDFTMDDAAEEINNLDISDTLKAKINHFVRWEVKDRDRFNSETLREEKHEKDFLEKYDLIKSDKVTKYLSGDTLEDVFGKDVQFEKEDKETQLAENIVQDSANMIGLAKSHYGTDDVLVYGPDLHGRIMKMPEGKEDGKSVKKILAAAGLQNELQAERQRLENKLPEATSGEIAVLKNRLRKVNQIIAKAEVEYRDLVSSASNQMNAARALRIIRNTFFKDLFADRILNDAERAQKEKMSKSLEETDIRDKVAEEGSFRTETEAAEEVAAAEAAMEEHEAKQAELFPDDPAAKRKAKSVIERFKDKVSGKKNKSDGRKEILKKEDAEKKAAKYLRGSSIEELIEKAKEQTKKPC